MFLKLGATCRVYEMSENSDKVMSPHSANQETTSINELKIHRVLEPIRGSYTKSISKR